jgi:hypothetical protein
MKSLREALNEVRSLETHPLVKKARKAHKDGVWDGNVDKNGNPIVHINGKPHTVVVEEIINEAMSKKMPLDVFARTVGIDKKEQQWIMDNEDEFGKYYNNSALKKSWLSLSYPVYDKDYYFAFIGDSERVNAKLNAEANRKLRDLAKSSLDNEAIFDEMTKLFGMTAYSNVGAGDTMTRDELWRAIQHIRGDYRESVEEGKLGNIARALLDKMRKRAKKIRLPESQESLQEADMFKVAKEFENYARKSGGIDKKDFMRVAGFLRDIGKNSNVNKQDQLFIQMKYYIDKLDTDVRDGMITLFQKNGMVKNNRLTREGLDEMRHKFVFDKAVNLDKAEKIAQKLGMKTDSETGRDYYYLSVDDGGNSGNLLKFLKATDGLHEESIIEMKFNRDGKKIEITKSGPSTKPTFHLKINGKDHGKFDQEKKAMQYVASLKEDDLEEAPKAPKLKGLDMYGAEIRGLRGKTGTMHTATAVKMGPNKLGFKVVDEFGSVETIDLKTFARKFG